MPTKAAYKKLDSDGELEFDYFLAAKLRMTVGELHERMSADEWRHWNMYYARIQQRHELERLKAGGDNG